MAISAAEPEALGKVPLLCESGIFKSALHPEDEAGVVYSALLRSVSTTTELEPRTCKVARSVILTTRPRLSTKITQTAI